MFRFLYSVTQTLGTVGSLAVSSIDVNTLPVLMIIMRSRSNTEIFTIVHGNVGVNELLTNLVQAVDVFQVRCFVFFTLSRNINALFAIKYTVLISVYFNCKSEHTLLHIPTLQNRNKDELILALKKNDRLEKELSKNKIEHIKKVWQLIGNKKFI